MVLTEGDLTPCPVVNHAGDGDRLLRAVDVGSGVDGEQAVLVLLHACFDAVQNTIWSCIPSWLRLRVAATRLARHNVHGVRQFVTCDIGLAVVCWKKKKQSSEVKFSALF